MAVERLPPLRNCLVRPAGRALYLQRRGMSERSTLRLTHANVGESKIDFEVRMEFQKGKLANLRRMIEFSKERFYTRTERETYTLKETHTLRETHKQ